MKSIEYKIAQSESDWLRYKKENMGIRESTGCFFRAIKKRVWKRFYGMTRTFFFGIKKTKFHPAYDENKQNIVVSFTSTAARIKHVFPTLNSLAVQTRKPDLVVLWLSKDEVFPKRTLEKIKAM